MGHHTGAGVKPGSGRSVIPTVTVRRMYEASVGIMLRVSSCAARCTNNNNNTHMNINNTRVITNTHIRISTTTHR